MTAGWTDRLARSAARLLVAAGLLVSVNAAAQDIRCTLESLEECITPEQVELLLPLLREARIAADEGRWQDALDNLRQADAIVPLGITRATMARAHYELGDTTRARSLSESLLDDPDADARAMAEELLQRLDSNPEPATTHDPGGPGAERPDSVASAPPESVAATLPGTELIVQPDVPQRDPRMRAVLAGLGAASVATLSVGIVSGLRAEQRENDAATYDLSAPNASRAEQDDIGLSASRAARLANVMFITSALVGGTAIGLAVGDRPRRVRASLAWTGSGPGLVVGTSYRPLNPQ